MKKIGFLSMLVMVIGVLSCNKKEYKSVTQDPALYSNTMHELNYVIIYDIFNPPVASRIFAYANLAAYETLAKEGKHYASLAGKLNGLNDIPAPAKPAQVDYPFASLIAMTKWARRLLFPKTGCRP